MPKVTTGLEYKTLTECRYCFPKEALGDVQNVKATYKDLHLYMDFYCYSNNTKKKLVYLGGTIPVIYEGNVYNIPVCIWLHETHPQSPPKCYVCPSPSLVINEKSHSVDAGGQVLLDCLRNWKNGLSNLSLLLEEMRAAFQRETPLFEANPTTAPLSLPPGSGSSFGFPEPPRQHAADSRSTTGYSRIPENMKSSVSPGQPARESNNANPSQSGSRRLSTGGKSYTEELLDLGITFGDPGAQSHPPSNSFTTCDSAPRTSSYSLEDIDNLFKSLQMENIFKINQLGSNKKEISDPATESRGAVHAPGTSPGHMPMRDSELRHKTGVLGPNEPNFPIQPKKLDPSQVLVPDSVPGHKVEMFQSLLSMEGHRFRPADVLTAVLSCPDVTSAKKYLCHECPICQEQVSFNKIIHMVHCSCFFCENCFKAYFSLTIKEKSIQHVVCPICNRPDVCGPGHREEAMEYFSLLDIQLRHYLDPSTHELFQRKLRDRALQEMPSFRWCAHCSFGLLHEAERLRMDCPSCGKSTCSQCKSAWAPQHERVSCEKFKQWQLQNNPQYQAARLESVLSRNKIDCPKCKFRFYLSKGGCLHFKCTQCQHEFCGGCSRPFKLGSACGFSAECGPKGLHAHHPRDCLYHLRDWTVPRLQELLKRHNVGHPLLAPHTDLAHTNSTGVCSIVEHRESAGQKEMPCGRPALPEFGDYCTVHYKEQLVEVINQHRLDPAVLFDLAEMEMELLRWRVAIPQRSPWEPEEEYMRWLRQILTQKVGLRTDEAVVTEGKGRPLPPWSSTPQNISDRSLSDDPQLLLLLKD